MAAATSAARLVAADGTPLSQGIAAFDLGGNLTDTAKAVAVQPDGKIVLAGTALGPTYWYVAVARFLPSGSLDASFGTGGMVANFSTAAAGSGVALQVLSNGKILVAWTFEHPLAGDRDFEVARLLGNGDLDTTFGTQGYALVTFNAGGTDNDDLQAMAVDRSGRILLVGSADVAAGDRDFAVARLTASGGLDATFGVGGRAVVALYPPTPTLDIGRAVSLDPWGRIVVAGSTKVIGAGSFDVAVVRLLADGTSDSDFGFGGGVVLPANAGGNGDDHAYAVAVQADGKIVLGGSLTVGDGQWVWLVARLALNGWGGLSGGALDPAFAAGQGHLLGTFACGALQESCVSRDAARGLALQSNGKIVFAGVGRGLHAPGLDNDDFGVARLLADGTPDATFGDGGDGTRTFDFARGPGSQHDGGYALAFAPDGPVVVAGAAEWNGFDTDFAWVRFADAELFADDFESGAAAAWSAALP